MWIQGLEEGGTTSGGAKKCPVDTFLARGKVHRQQGAVREDCEMLSIGKRQQTEKSDRLEND